MSAAPAAVVLFCLGTGAAMGGLFLLFRLFVLLFGGGKLVETAADLIFCCVCGAAVFLCALAVDHGRLRLIQALLQAAGAWAAITAFSPFITAAADGIRAFARLLRRALSGLKRALGRLVPRFARKKRENREKTERKRKKL